VRQRSHDRLERTSLGDWIAASLPHLPAALAGDGVRSHLLRAARDLPGDCAAALEIRLAPDAGNLDLSIQLTRPAQALRLADTIRVPALRDLLVPWAQGDPLASPVSSVWLEFDLDPGVEGLPAPVVCAGLRENVDPGWLTDWLLPALRGGALEEEQRRLIHRCLGGMPASGRLLYAFSLRSRGSDAVRLEILGLDPPSLSSFIRDLAPQATERVARLAALFAAADRIHLSFDVAREISPRIGIEGSFLRPPSRERRWKGLFDSLVSRGWCSPEKSDAVLGWPGHESFWTAPEGWPLEAARRGFFCVRSLSHVKLVSLPDREPEAKAYLLLTPFQRSPPAGS
jgi:hypothetical protein